MPDLPAIAPSPLLRDIVDLMIQGNSLPAIHDYITSHGGDPATTIADAHGYFAAVAIRSRPESVLGMVLEGYRDIYRQALTVGDLPTARGCLKDMKSLAIEMSGYEMDGPKDACGVAKAGKRPKVATVEPSKAARGRKGG